MEGTEKRFYELVVAIDMEKLSETTDELISLMEKSINEEEFIESYADEDNLILIYEVEDLLDRLIEVKSLIEATVKKENISYLNFKMYTKKSKMLVEDILYKYYLELEM